MCIKDAICWQNFDQTTVQRHARPEPPPDRLVYEKFPSRTVIVIVIVATLFAIFLSACSDRVCIRSETYTHLQPMQVGKSLILMPMTLSRCAEYGEESKK